MLTRRSLGRLALAGAAGWTEAALAQRALPQGNIPADAVWLNANENPEGPPAAALQALAEAGPRCGRYGFQEFRAFEALLERREEAPPGGVVAGTGSTEVLNAAVLAFTSATLPVIASDPTFEAPAETARALGRPVIRVPHTGRWGADVKRLAAEAEKAGGGLIYICNPNNPTSSLTPREDLAWLAAGLPKETVLLLDEAYLDFVPDFPRITAMQEVRQGRNVIVTRTFSKIYGMAGLRMGYACGRPDLIRRLRAFRNNPLSLAAIRAASAAVTAGPGIVAERRERLLRTRGALCEWLQARGLRYIEPAANFVMIETGRDARELGMALLAKGVAVGRPFPPLHAMLRVTIGTGPEMEKFRSALAAVL